jgi:tripartite-type tricarboxylate transporter receptor subunit TctC
LSEKLQEKLKQPVVVENRPGAGSVIGANFVAKANPDGHTLLLMEPAAVLAKWMNKTVLYDVTNDFAPIALVATQPLVLFAHPSLPVNDVKELIAYSKANPGKLSVGTAGVGSPHHLAAVWLKDRNCARALSRRGLRSTSGRRIRSSGRCRWPVMPFVEQGKVKPLAVPTRQRYPLLPQVPTVDESTAPGFDVDFFYGIAAPAKVQPGIVAHVRDAIREITELPDVRTRMSTLGMSVDFRDSEQFRELIAREYQKYGAVIRKAGIQPE